MITILQVLEDGSWVYTGLFTSNRNQANRAIAALTRENKSYMAVDVRELVEMVHIWRAPSLPIRKDNGR